LAHPDDMIAKKKNPGAEKERKAKDGVLHKFCKKQSRGRRAKSKELALKLWQNRRWQRAKMGGGDSCTREALRNIRGLSLERE